MIPLTVPEITRLLTTPPGHLGEWIAAQVFGIELEQSAVTAAIDDHFRFGPLQGCTVNVKWYLKQEGLLDMTKSSTLDYYLVLTGPRSAAVTSRSHDHTVSTVPRQTPPDSGKISTGLGWGFTAERGGRTR